MDLTKLPEVLEDIVLDFASQIEHTRKFQKTLNTIKTLKLSRSSMGNMRNTDKKTYYIFYSITDDNMFINKKTPNKKTMIKKVVNYINYNRFNGSYFDFFDINEPIDWEQYYF